MRQKAAGLLEKLERAKGIEPSTYSLGSYLVFRLINSLAAKLRPSRLKHIKGLTAPYKTPTADSPISTAEPFLKIIVVLRHSSSHRHERHWG